MKQQGASILLDQLRTSDLLEKADPMFLEALTQGIAALAYCSVFNLSPNMKPLCYSRDKLTDTAIINDLEMIMKEAPDLKSLEKMIADYITEKRGEMPKEVT